MRLSYGPMENISERIGTLMREAGYQQTDLADITGATSGTTSNWINGRSKPDGASLIKLAAHFKVEAEWLKLGGVSSVREARAEYRARRGAMPLYSYRELGAGALAEDVWVSLGIETTGAFALRVEGDAMQGVGGIPADAIAICDPSQEPANGHVVVVRTDESIRVRRLSIEGEDHYLLASHAGFPVQVLTPTDTVLGVVMGYTVSL